MALLQLQFEPGNKIFNLNPFQKRRETLSFNTFTKTEVRYALDFNEILGKIFNEIDFRQFLMIST